MLEYGEKLEACKGRSLQRVRGQGTSQERGDGVVYVYRYM